MKNTIKDAIWKKITNNEAISDSYKNYIETECKNRIDNLENLIEKWIPVVHSYEHEDGIIDYNVIYSFYIKRYGTETEIAQQNADIKVIKDIKEFLDKTDTNKILREELKSRGYVDFNLDTNLDNDGTVAGVMDFFAVFKVNN